MYGGEGGDDYLVAYGGGSDQMEGGAGGADTFIFTTEVEGKGVVTDFTQGEDLLAIQYDLATTAEDQYERFLEDAVQVGNHVVWTSPDGKYSIRLEDVQLDALSVADFTSVEGELVLAV